MDVSSLHEGIVLLEHWAPQILSQGANASREDLIEVLKLRVRMENAMIEECDKGNPEAFFMTLKADRACELHCGALLSLSVEEAVQAASDAGGTLDPKAWYGVHTWELTNTHLADWTRQISEVSGVAVTPCEVMLSVSAYWREKGQEYINNWFTTPKGSWSPTLDLEDQTEISEMILKHRPTKEAL